MRSIFTPKTLHTGLVRRSAAAFCVLFAFSGPALGEEKGPSPEKQSTPSRETRESEGGGLAVTADGKTRMRLNLDVAGGLDTNPYSVPTAAQGEDFVGDMILRLRPGVDIGNSGSDLKWDGGGSVDYGMMPGAFNEKTSTYFLYHADAQASLEMNRGSPLSFAARNDFSWFSDPGQVTLGTLINRIFNDTRLGLGFVPGGGALTVRGDYKFGNEIWLTPIGEERNAASPFVRGDYDRMSHEAHTRIDWRFFPRTGLFVDLKGGFHTYGGNKVNPDAFPVWARGGLVGQFSKKLSGVISGGYANPLIQEDTRAPINAMAHLELRWAPSLNTQVGGGFKRDINPTAVYQFLESNKGYLQLSQNVGRRIKLKMDANVSLLAFGLEQFEDIQLTDKPLGDRVDYKIGLLLDLNYQVLEWVSVGIIERLDWRISNAKAMLPDGVTVNTETGSFDYIRNELLLAVTMRY